MDDGPARPRAYTLLRAIVVALGLVTLAGLVALWPGEADVELSEGLTTTTARADVTQVDTGPCPPPQMGECASAGFETEGGQVGTLQLGTGTLAPELEPGDEIRVQRVAALPGSPATAVQAQYAFVDFERRSPMLWLALAFAALVVLFGRLRGALSLVGLVASLGVVVLFVVPAILDGSSPLLVAIVGASAVMLLTIPLAHGLGAKSMAAILGTTLSLALVAALASAFTELTNLTGFAAEELTLLQAAGVEVSFQGLLLAGMVIGALGVLDDVTVSQASTVLALRRANPGFGVGRLYREAIEVGRDHVSATVNTLVLAYVGAALPVLLIFGSGDLGVFDAVNFEIVAQEIVAMLVGSIGLIAAVPITTGLAAALAPGLPPEALEDAHAHGH
jgi:uncharacterized membrane protein